MRKKVILLSTFIALAWNLSIVSAATLNISNFSQITGVQIQNLPLAIRLLYGVQAAVTLFQFFFIFRLFQRGGTWSKSSYLLARIFLILSVVDAVVNIVSHNSSERWHGIASGIIALGFYELAALRFHPKK